MPKLPKTRQRMSDLLADQKRQIARQANASPYSLSGTRVTAENVVEVTGQLRAEDFDGDLAAGDPGTQGWAMDKDRAAFGELLLRPGSVGNDALANPIQIDRGATNADGFTVTTTDTNFASFTIPIPAGFTRVLVKAEGMAFCYNDSAVGDYFYCRVHVDSPTEVSWSRRLLADLNANGGASLTVTKQAMFEGLTGGDITIWIELKTAFASMAHASNGATVTAAAWFLR